MMAMWHIAAFVPQTFDIWAREEIDVDAGRNVDILTVFSSCQLLTVYKQCKYFYISTQELSLKINKGIQSAAAIF